MRIEVVTLFPEFVTESLRIGVVGRAIERGLVSFAATSPREFATDVHRTVDDRPYGGGPGNGAEDRADAHRVASGEGAVAGRDRAASISPPMARR